MFTRSKALPAGPQPGRFWRYNYQIIAGAGYWALAVPVATSQLVTLWMMALSTDFQQTTANRIAELMTPVLGAFLVANSLAPEYRSGVGAVLACKPVSLTRVLAIRAGLGMLAALLLSFITLWVCSVGLKPVEIWPPLLASIPSLFFLSSLALLFATIFRNPLGGFAVALGLWCFDFALGYYVHPFFSIQGYSGANDGDTLAQRLWIIGKGVQVAFGVALWLVHQRQLPRICRPPERRDVLRIAATCAAVMAVYCYTGAASVLTYAYSQRARLPTRDVIWLRRYLSIYGPAPVARLFGPAFAAYVSEPPQSKEKDARTLHAEQLRQALERWPKSIWADGMAYTLATEVEGSNPQEAATLYLAVADRYPESPFASRALLMVIRGSEQVASPDIRLLAARRLIAEYSNTPEAEAAAATLDEFHPERVNSTDLLKAALIAVKVAPAHLQPGWMVRAAQLEQQAGQRSEALDHARKARALAEELRRQVGDSDRGMELRPHLARIDGAREAAEKIIREQGGQP